MKNSLTNLFVVGAMKAGTTTLVDLLSKHSDIHVPPIKEPHYFVNHLSDRFYRPSRFFDLESYFENKFPEPLHITKIDGEEDYRKAYSLASENEDYLVDASTCYLNAPESPQLIYKYNPNAKIIVLLRDPVKRTFSDYRMNVGLGRENRSFQRVMEEELRQYWNKDLAWESYLGMSFYDSAIARYRQYFSDILILNFNELITHQDATLGKIANFLSLSEFDTSLEPAALNKTRQLRSRTLIYYLNRIGVKDYFSAVFSAGFKQRVFNLISKEREAEMNLDKDTLTSLMQVFYKESSYAFT